MIFNNVDLSPYIRIIDIRGRGVSSSEITGISVTGMDGEHFSYARIPTRYIEVDFEIRAKNREELREKIDRISAVLITPKPVSFIFADEPNMTYWGAVEAVEEDKEYIHIGKHRATMHIRRSDPYKYGPELNIDFPSDSVIVENPGTTEAEPIFELEATQKTTFAMVSNQDEYNLIGRPADTTETVVDSRQLIFREDGSTLKNWSNTPKILDTNFSVANGSLTGDPTGIYAENYGSSNDKNHGGYKIVELPKALQDFRIETHFDVDTPTDAETFRIEVYAIAEDMSMLGKIGMLDGNVNLKRRVGLARVGEYVGYGKNYTHYSGNYQHDRVGSSQTWYLRFIREGRQVRTRIARRLRGEQVRGKNGIFNIIDDNMLKRLRYIGVYIGFFGTTQRPRLARINHVDVYEIFKTEEDHTPYIIFPGDTITFDHTSDEILLNGENAMVHKDFGGRFFRLARGYNTLTVMPNDAFNVKLKFRPRYR